MNVMYYGAILNMLQSQRRYKSSFSGDGISRNIRRVTDYELIVTNIVEESEFEECVNDVKKIMFGSCGERPICYDIQFYPNFSVVYLSLSRQYVGKNENGEYIHSDFIDQIVFASLLIDYIHLRLIDLNIDVIK